MKFLCNIERTYVITAKDMDQAYEMLLEAVEDVGGAHIASLSTFGHIMKNKSGKTVISRVPFAKLKKIYTNTKEGSALQVPKRR